MFCFFLKQLISDRRWLRDHTKATVRQRRIILKLKDAHYGRWCRGHFEQQELCQKLVDAYPKHLVKVKLANRHLIIYLSPLDERKSEINSNLFLKSLEMFHQTTAQRIIKHLKWPWNSWLWTSEHSCVLQSPSMKTKRCICHLLVVKLFIFYVCFSGRILSLQ